MTRNADFGVLLTSSVFINFCVAKEAKHVYKQIELAEEHFATGVGHYFYLSHY